jgi:tetratricopeptide (TPR) repeat protein
VALYRLEQYSEAEQAARRALAIDPGLNRARLILGLSLVAIGKESVEAIDALRRAAGDFPRAHVAAAEALARMGRSSDAAAELRAYLSSGDQAMRASATSALAALNAASRP